LWSLDKCLNEQHQIEEKEMNCIVRSRLGLIVDEKGGGSIGLLSPFRRCPSPLSSSLRILTSCSAPGSGGSLVLGNPSPFISAAGGSRGLATERSREGPLARRKRSPVRLESSAKSESKSPSAAPKRGNPIEDMMEEVMSSPMFPKLGKKVQTKVLSDIRYESDKRVLVFTIPIILTLTGKRTQWHLRQNKSEPKEIGVNAQFRATPIIPEVMKLIDELVSNTHFIVVSMSPSPSTFTTESPSLTLLVLMITPHSNWVSARDRRYRERKTPMNAK